MKIVCIGNSNINGFPHKRSQCFVSLWRQATGHEIINKGENGDIISNVYARFEKDVISHRPDTAVVLTGTNDFISEHCTPEEVLNYMDKIAELAKTKSINIIFLTPLLVDIAMAKKLWKPGVDYSAVNEQLKTLRSLMLAYGEKNHISIIDTQKQFSELYTKANVSDYLLDGIHPTVLGHKAMAKFLPD